MTFRDANVVYNSLNTQMCASLPLNTLKNAKEAKSMARIHKHADRHTDRQTYKLRYRLLVTTTTTINTVTYRDANVVYNSLNTQIFASLLLNSLKNAKKA